VAYCALLKDASILFAMKLCKPAAECAHMSTTTADPQTQGCQECGSTFNLRLCSECQHVGCCESQRGHNTAHARASGHPVIKSFPIAPGSFSWCYSCNRYV
jgi:uncharacterized UBP type Zn finger protein